MQPTDKSRTAALFVNSRSRLGSDGYSEVCKRLVDGGLELVEARTCRRLKDLVGATREHVRRGTPEIIVGGGDGTLSAVAQVLANTGILLGVLPLGTGNAFARDLGIPSSIDGACEIILTGKSSRVDLGLVQDQAFLNVVTVGLSTGIALGLTDESKKRLGQAVYIGSILKALATVRPFRVTLELDKGSYQFDSLQVVIGNGHFHAGPFPIAPDASITGGSLFVYALASDRKAELLKLALHMFGGRHIKLPTVRSFRVRSGKLTTDPSRRATVDGEVCLRTPVSFSVMPRALQVIVSPDFNLSPREAS